MIELQIQKLKFWGFNFDMFFLCGCLLDVQFSADGNGFVHNLIVKVFVFLVDDKPNI